MVTLGKDDLAVALVGMWVMGIASLHLFYLVRYSIQRRRDAKEHQFERRIELMRDQIKSEVIQQLEIDPNDFEEDAEEPPNYYPPGPVEDRQPRDS